MRCSPCVLEVRDATASLDDFLDKLLSCDECPLRAGEGGAPAVRLLVERHAAAARALRRLGQRARAAEAHARDLEASIAAQAAKMSLLEAFQKASAAEADAELRAKIALLEQKEEAILRIGAPIIQVLEGVVVLPLIGEIDVRRAASMTGALLDEVQRIGATHVVLDLTGASSLTVETAEHLARMARAATLLGAHLLLTGMRAELARAVIELGVDLSGFPTLPSLKAAIASISRERRAARAAG
ncbi:MAG: STAS domain-containing protein [Polyangiaceae bacterium]|nr:STAS domain-containing protein [Polyangiaceae bacterium]